MSSAHGDGRFDELAAQVHEWVESAVALDEGHFPQELLSELRDLVSELQEFLEDDEHDYTRGDVTELFVTPEMAEVIHRFPKVRRLLEGAWGTQVMDLIEEEGAGFSSSDEEDEEE
ncbi:MAG: hypothetical protein M3483_06665 [Gemmatimonadota bacterium]|nr:hypothetical protein [Gemmatimonadota bacterium]